MKERFYLFIDETGQDTGGRFFLVAIVVVAGAHRDRLETDFLRLESRSGRINRKWTRSSLASRAEFLEGLSSLDGARYFWKAWNSGCDYIERCAEATWGALRSVEGAGVVVIDAIKEAERALIRRWLKTRGVTPHNIPLEPRDEANPLLRLADATAGFLRDVHEKQPYAVEAWKKLDSIFEPL